MFSKTKSFVTAEVFLKAYQSDLLEKIKDLYMSEIEFKKMFKRENAKVLNDYINRFIGMEKLNFRDIPARVCNVRHIHDGRKFLSEDRLQKFLDSILPEIIKQTFNQLGDELKLDYVDPWQMHQYWDSKESPLLSDLFKLPPLLAHPLSKMQEMTEKKPLALPEVPEGPDHCLPASNQTSKRRKMS